MTEAQRQTDSQAVGRPLVVFRLNEQSYALDLDRIERALRVVAMAPLPHAPAIVLGVVNLGGSVVPVIDMHGRFDHPVHTTRLSDHLLVAVTHRRTVALLVDEVRGVILAAPEKCTADDGILPRLELVAGALVLDDGLILIHDLDRLLSLDEEAAIDTALTEAAAAEG